MSSVSRGKARMQDKFGKEVLLDDVLLVPNLGVNLVSGRKLCQQFLFQGIMTPNSFTLVDQQWEPRLECSVLAGCYAIQKILGQWEILLKD